jgi:hypothetical protein
MLDLNCTLTCCLKSLPIYKCIFERLELKKEMIGELPTFKFDRLRHFDDKNTKIMTEHLSKIH